MDKNTTGIQIGFRSGNRKAAPQTKIENRAGWSRREFLNEMTLAGAAGLLGVRSEALAAEPPLETNRIRLVHSSAICFAPEYIAEELLFSEGFNDVQYVKSAGGLASSVDMAAGKIDIGVNFVGNPILQIDAGEPIVLLGGLHAGCYELFASERIRSLHDLKGKRVAVTALRSGRHLFLASIMTHVGLDPRKDVHWITDPPATAVRLFAEGKVDALMGFPPEPQALRAKKIGHVVVNTTTDKPWSQYFCCAISANREFVRKHPVATKRALRATLKAIQICASEPERVARFLVDKGYTGQYSYALQTLKELPYGKWRDFDIEDTVRFYALRLHEAGMIKSSPQKILAQGTDWRFLRELKKELKA